VAYGDVEGGIIITGLTASGIQLQNHVDRMGDVPTVAILGAYMYPH